MIIPYEYISVNIYWSIQKTLISECFLNLCKLTLSPLWSAASTFKSWLLTLFLTVITGKQTVLFQNQANIFAHGSERLSNTVLQGLRLSISTATIYSSVEVEVVA